MEHKTFAAFVCLSSASVAAFANDPVDNGALDQTFGTGGQVRILPSTEFQNATSLNGVAIAVQSSGKIIVAGSDDQNDCFVARLNVDGSLDTSFGNGNVRPGFAGFGLCTADDVAVRPDDRILLLSHGTSPIGPNAVLLSQFEPNGADDPTWISNPPYFGVYIAPPAGDSIVAKALLIDSLDQYALGNTYVVGQYTHGGNGQTDVFYAGVSADGKTTVTATYDASKGSTHNASATSVTEQASTGNIIIGGYATSSANDLDCIVLSAIILPNPAFPEAYLYNSFGTAGATAVPFNQGGGNNDQCNAVTTVQPGDYIAVGGSADTTFTAGANTYPDQRAGVALLDPTGHIVKWINAQTSQSFNAQDFFSWSGAGANGGLNTITRLIPYPYGRPVNGEQPSLITVGYGYHALAVPYTGIDMGLERLTMPGVNNNFFADPTLNAQHPLLVDFGSHVNPGGQTAFTSTDEAHSALLKNGRLLMVGSATDPNGGSDLAVMRFAPFDGIFHSGLEAIPAF